MANLLTIFPFMSQLEESFEGKCRLRLSSREERLDYLLDEQELNFESDIEYWSDCFISCYYPSKTLVLTIKLEIYQIQEYNDPTIEVFYTNSTSFLDQNLLNFPSTKILYFHLKSIINVGNKLLVLGSLERFVNFENEDLVHHDLTNNIIYQFDALLQFDYSKSIEELMLKNIEKEKTKYLNCLSDSNFFVGATSYSNELNVIFWHGIANIFYSSSTFSIENNINDIAGNILYTDLNEFNDINLFDNILFKSLVTFESRFINSIEINSIKIQTSSIFNNSFVFPQSISFSLGAENENSTELIIEQNESHQHLFGRLVNASVELKYIFLTNNMYLIYGDLKLCYMSNEHTRTDAHSVLILLKNQDDIAEFIESVPLIRKAEKWYIVDNYTDLFP